MIYNIKKNETSGKDSIPNIEFWREFPSLVQDGMALSIKSLKNVVTFIKAKIAGNTSSSYNEL